MTKYELGELVAERKLDLVVDNATNIQCSIKVGKPVQIDEDTWVCPYQIVVGERIRTLGMHGIDSMQALVLTIQTLDVEIAHVAKMCNAYVQYLDGSHNSVFDPELSFFNGGYWP
jgi:hypothetical protein